MTTAASRRFRTLVGRCRTQRLPEKRPSVNSCVPHRTSTSRLSRGHSGVSWSPGHAGPILLGVQLIDVVVETPPGSRNSTRSMSTPGLVWLDRRLPGAFAFPAGYGYVPCAFGSDDEPLDAFDIYRSLDLAARLNATGMREQQRRSESSRGRR